MQPKELNTVLKNLFDAKRLYQSLNNPALEAVEVYNYLAAADKHLTDAIAELIEANAEA